jgi:hypothetical protein
MNGYKVEYLLDTGADMVVISERTFKRTGAKVIDKPVEKVSSANGNVEIVCEAEVLLNFMGQESVCPVMVARHLKKDCVIGGKILADHAAVGSIYGEQRSV